MLLPTSKGLFSVQWPFSIVKWRYRLKDRYQKSRDWSKNNRIPEVLCGERKI